MKKIFLFGRMLRIFFIISFLFILYAMIDMCVASEFEIKYILFTLIVLFFVVIGLFWIYSLGIVFDFRKNTFKLILGLSNKNKHERVLKNISSVDIVNNSNLGIEFVINYLDGGSEKIFYHFYRISFLEKLQFKRLKKQLNHVKFR
ncbi:MAG: hypothetical protein IJD18_03405 [Clostridia bacterium]|nr:hypothetical protein [Clostridia bacterium]